MSNHDEELIKELKKLKIKNSLDSKQRESMKMTLREHAKKKQTHTKHKAKTKKTFIWFSTAAAILICSVFVYYIANNNQLSMPIADQESSEQANDMAKDSNEAESSALLEEKAEESGTEENEAKSVEEENENAGEQETTAFSIEEHGEETATIMLEGTEEDTTVYNYTLEPSGISFQIDEFLNNYKVENDEVRFYSDAENAEVRLRVEEDTTVEQVLPTVQENYEGENDATATQEGENPYSGMMQHYSDPPHGFYLYQIDNDVLITQHEYVIQAADGMQPRLALFRQSIQ